jgi:acetyl esterase/lipase
MKIISLLIFVITLCSGFHSTIAQTFVQSDTSFTVYSAFDKAVKEYPFIKIVKPVLPKNVIAEDNIVYKSVEGHKLRLDLFYPKDGNKYPAVLLIHGGGWSSGDKSHLVPMAQKLALKGYVAASLEYRLSPEAKYPAAIYDIKDAIKWLRANAEKYKIDTNKIAALGCSAGGHLAALAGTTNGLTKFEDKNGDSKHSSNVQAIVDMDGVLDFTDPHESGKDKDPLKPSAGKRWLGYSYKENPEIWVEVSPLTYVGKNTPPIAFINSSLPRFRGGHEETREILKKYNIYYEVHTIPDTPHPFWLFHPWFEKAFQYVVNFLNKSLKGK